jgi:hypothetical protein
VRHPAVHYYQTFSNPPLLAANSLATSVPRY